MMSESNTFEKNQKEKNEICGLLCEKVNIE